MRRNTISPTLRGKGRDGGIDEPYGRARIVSTDPDRSNSGFMFAGLVSSLMSGDVATQELLAQRGDQAKAIFRSMGLKSSSSGKLLDQYIAGGLGAEPMVIGYENQLANGRSPIQPAGKGCRPALGAKPEIL